MRTALRALLTAAILIPALPLGGGETSQKAHELAKEAQDLSSTHLVQLLSLKQKLSNPVEREAAEEHMERMIKGWIFEHKKPYPFLRFLEPKEGDSPEVLAALESLTDTCHAEALWFPTVYTPRTLGPRPILEVLAELAEDAGTVLNPEGSAEISRAEERIRDHQATVEVGAGTTWEAIRSLGEKTGNTVKKGHGMGANPLFVAHSGLPYPSDINGPLWCRVTRVEEKLEEKRNLERGYGSRTHVLTIDADILAEAKLSVLKYSQDVTVIEAVTDIGEHLRSQKEKKENEEPVFIFNYGQHLTLRLPLTPPPKEAKELHLTIDVPIVGTAYIPRPIPLEKGRSVHCGLATLTVEQVIPYGNGGGEAVLALSMTPSVEDATFLFQKGVVLGWKGKEGKWSTKEWEKLGHGKNTKTLFFDHLPSHIGMASPLTPQRRDVRFSFTIPLPQNQ